MESISSSPDVYLGVFHHHRHLCQHDIQSAENTGFFFSNTNHPSLTLLPVMILSVSCLVAKIHLLFLPAIQGAGSFTQMCFCLTRRDLVRFFVCCHITIIIIILIFFSDQQPFLLHSPSPMDSGAAKCHRCQRERSHDSLSGRRIS